MSRNNHLINTINCSLVAINLLWCSLLCYYTKHQPRSIKLDGNRICLPMPPCTKEYKIVIPFHNRLVFRLIALSAVALLQVGLSYWWPAYDEMALVCYTLFGWEYIEPASTLPLFKEKYVDSMNLTGLINYSRYCYLQRAVYGANCLGVLVSFTGEYWTAMTILIANTCAMLLGMMVNVWESEILLKNYSENLVRNSEANIDE